VRRAKVLKKRKITNIMITFVWDIAT
jgi:hypothetical protein